MNILIDIGHPAHVHLFKNFIFEMNKKSHNIITTVKDEKSIIDLLKRYKIEFIKLGKKGKKVNDKIIKQAIFDLKVLYYLYRYNVDIAMGTSVSIAHACLFHKSKSYIFNEDDINSAPFFAKTAYPFAYRIITPVSLNENHGKKHIQLNTLHELAYLHPKYFQPNESILKELGIKKQDKYCQTRSP